MFPAELIAIGDEVGHRRRPARASGTSGAPSPTSCPTTAGSWAACPARPARLLKGALYYARQARRYRGEPAGPVMLDRMLECQLAAELEPALPTSTTRFESVYRAAEVAELLAMVLGQDGQ